MRIVKYNFPCSGWHKDFRLSYMCIHQPKIQHYGTTVTTKIIVSWCSKLSKDDWSGISKRRVETLWCGNDMPLSKSWITGQYTHTQNKWIRRRKVKV